MPTYTYRCRSCGYEQDLDVYYNDAELSLGELRCDRAYAPEEPHQGCHDEFCQGFMRRVWAIGGIVFKGSGFYSKDSRPKPKPETESKNKSKDKPDGSK
jgi:predicted nucleic acid-binding Zn ribbon protein